MQSTFVSALWNLALSLLQENAKQDARIKELETEIRESKRGGMSWEDIENRDWYTGYRGTVYLHASKWWNIGEISDDWDTIADITGATFSTEQLRDIAIKTRDAGGMIVGQVDIVGCVRESDSPWFFGKFGFQLKNPVAFEKPWPVKGALGFFDVTQPPKG